MRRSPGIAFAGVLVLGLLAACSSAPQVVGPATSQSPGSAGSTAGLTGIHKIRHVIIVMQENRSFDNFFGTYPGADGIQMRNGTATVCVPNPTGGCLRPFHDTADVDGGGPHGQKNAIADMAGGKMNGFLAQRAMPPQVDRNGYGLRVPAIIISPYAKKGVIDHQTLSSDAYLKFIENDFLDGTRLNPKTDKRPDRRPDVREEAKQLGSLTADFNFNQAPRPPFLLPTNPPTDSPAIPSFFHNAPTCVGCTTLPPAYAQPKVGRRTRKGTAG